MACEGKWLVGEEKWGRGASCEGLGVVKGGGEFGSKAEPIYV